MKRKAGGYIKGTHHSPRGGAGTRPHHPSSGAFDKEMRGLEGLHRGVSQGGAAKRRAKRLEGKPV